MKKTNNKGFSLVELIVVIAIMAVLMVVVGPQLLRYVDKSRQQRDESAAAEFLHAVEIALADEEIYNDTKDGAKINAPDDDAFSATDAAKLLTEIKLVFPEGEFNFSSNAYDNKQYTVTISKTTDGVKLSESWGELPATP